MTLDLAALRAMRKNSAASLAKITQELSKQDFGKKEDDRMWKATVDKAGTGSAVIRFLPSLTDGGLPWVKVYDHGFQGPTGKWYIEKCLTTLGQSDPVAEYCNKLWTGSEEDKEKARKMKRRLSYYSNVLVVKDPGNPANEGKVFIFKFGKKIHDKLVSALKPEFEDEKPILFHDPFEGANFRLRIRKVDGWSNTDKSDFDSVTPIADDEEEMLAILNARHDMSDLIDAKTFKSYDELSKKFDMVMNGSSAGMSKASEFTLEEDTPKPKVQAKVAEEPKRREVATVTDDEDDMAFFKNLVDD
jgi:hypothetical protein